MKTGKKRRSVISLKFGKFGKIKAKDIILAYRSRFYERIPAILPFIFTYAKDFKIKDQQLKNDIEEAMNAIIKIEELESVKKSVNPAYRNHEYVQHIDRLNTIIAKNPVPIRAVFSHFAHVARRAEVLQIGKHKESGWDGAYKRMVRVKEALEKVKKFPKIKFYPDPHDYLDFPEGCADEEGVRYYLAVGLLDYLQKLILGESYRVRQCRSCEEWFIATKSNNVTCGEQLCKETYWREYRGGSEYRKNYMKGYRIKKKLKK